MVLAGLVAGLLVAELVFRWRDDGAFPHLNVYRADPELGVRLRPGATQRLAFGGNPTTSIRINGDGFRGAELPPPGKDEVLVVGDSQVFGLGVEEDQTFSARLAAALHRTVVNAGVPTYGPGEYRQVIAEQLARRHPKTVVFTLNLVNDLFEDKRPNRERHAVWDGWAVRKESAPDGVTHFPGRELLYRRSHLFFALRRWWHRGDEIDRRGFASEGTWRDLVAAGEDVSAKRRADEARARERGEELATVQRQLERSEDGVDSAIRQALAGSQGFDYDALAKARANPGDIVEESDPYAEGGRLVSVTAQQIGTAARVRARLRKQLARWARAHRGETAEAARQSLETSDKLLAQLTELDAQRIQAALEPPLADTLRDVRKLVQGGGARLVVLILPIDVQVSADEWKKYGHDPIDMAPSRALTDELVELCRSLGVSALDASAPLAAAEPGAFLDKDIHMSPKGHAAVAAALAKTLAQPPPRPARASARSPVPVPALWQRSPEVIVRGSTAASCETKKIREWLRVLCTHGRELAPRGVELVRDDGGESMVMAMPHGVSLLIPVIEGREVAAKITWPDKTRVLHVRWPAGGKPEMAFDEPVVLRKKTAAEQSSLAYPRARQGDFVSPVERAICDCWNRLHGGSRYKDHFTCTGVYGAPDARCTETYAPGPGDGPSWPSEQLRRCEQMLACVRGDPGAPPSPP